MADNGVVSAGGRLTDWVSLGVLAAFVPRDAVDDAVAVAGKQAKRSDGKLPPHVMVYFVMALALFADDDYEEVAARLTETLTAWGCWDDSWSVPGSGGITQARQRLGYEPMKELFAEVAVPVAEELTAGAFLGPWRLMAIDGFEWDAPDTPENAAALGFAGTAADDPGRPAFPKVRVVTAREALLEAARGGQDPGEDQARYVRVVEYEVPDRDGDGKGEVIALVTTITEMTAAPAPLLAEAYAQRWEHETGNAQLKTYLRAGWVHCSGLPLRAGCDRARCSARPCCWMCCRLDCTMSPSFAPFLYL